MGSPSQQGQLWGQPSPPAQWPPAPLSAPPDSLGSVSRLTVGSRTAGSRLWLCLVLPGAGAGAKWGEWTVGLGPLVRAPVPLPAALWPHVPQGREWGARVALLRVALAPEQEQGLRGDRCPAPTAAPGWVEREPWSPAPAHLQTPHSREPLPPQMPRFCVWSRHRHSHWGRTRTVTVSVKPSARMTKDCSWTHSVAVTRTWKVICRAEWQGSGGAVGDLAHSPPLSPHRT